MTSSFRCRGRPGPRVAPDAARARAAAAPELAAAKVAAALVAEWGWVSARDWAPGGRTTVLPTTAIPATTFDQSVTMCHLSMALSPALSPGFLSLTKVYSGLPL